MSLYVLMIVLLSFFSPLTIASQSALDGQVEKAKQDRATAAREYVQSLETVLALQEANVKSAEQDVEKRKELLSQKIISKREFDSAVQSLDAARAKVRDTKKKIEEAKRLYSDVPEPINVPASPIRTPSVTSMGKNNQDVLLTLEDVKFLEDAISELTRLGFIIAMLDNRITYNLEQALSIIIRYCKCSRAEYIDYAKGSGLPSIINRMENVKYSRTDGIRLAALNETVEGIKEYRASKQQTYDATKSLLLNRMRDAFHGSLSARIDLYNLNLKEKKFTLVKQGDKVVPISEGVESYLADRIKNTSTEQIMKIIKDEMGEQAPPRKSPNKKTKKKPPVRIL